MLVWLTINDRVWYWHWRIIFQQVLMVHAQEMDTYISVGDIDQIFRKWLLFLKPDIIVAVPEGRRCCSVADIKYCCWVAEVITVLKFLKSEIVVEFFLKSAIIVQFLKSEIVIKFLKSDNVADIRYLVWYEALFIEASFAIAYCIEQYFSLYFSRCADATPIDTS